MSDKTIEQLAEAWELFKKENDSRLKAVESKGAADPLLVKKVDAVNEAVDKMVEQVKSAQAQAKAAEERASKLEAAFKRPGLGKAAEDLGVEAKTLAIFTAMHGEDADWAAHKSAVSMYLRKGKDEQVSSLQQKAMSVDSNQDGGFFVMPDTSGRIVQQVYETSPMRRLASVQAISTDALEGVYDLDEAAASWVGERETRSETNTPKVNVWRIPVHEIYAEPRATQKLLDDANVDVEAWLAGKVGNKFARAEATAFVTGDGDRKPRGFLTYATSASAPTATTWNVIQYMNTGANGDFAGSGLGGDNLINLHGLLKAEYLPGSVWAMNRTTKAKVRTLKSPANDYILQLDFRQGLAETVLGYPVESFEDMPVYTGTGALAVAFGNFAQAYQIVDRVGIRVLRDPYTAKPFVKFYTTKRVGGDVINFEAVKVLRFSA